MPGTGPKPHEIEHRHVPRWQKVMVRQNLCICGFYFAPRYRKSQAYCCEACRSKAYRVRRVMREEGITA